MNDPGLYTIAGYIPMSPQLAAEADEWNARVAEHQRLRQIGPVHGPDIPDALALRRRLGGHAAGPYTRTPKEIA